MVRKKLQFANDDRGFSLVELLVSILIMSVITGIVVMLISTSRRIYNSTETNATLQTESDVVKNTIGELAIEAQNCGLVNASGYSFIWLCAPDNDQDPSILRSDEDFKKYYYYVFLKKDGDDKLRFGKFEDREVPGTDPKVYTVRNSEGIIFGDGYTFPTEDEYSCNILTDPRAVLAEHLQKEHNKSGRQDIFCSVTAENNLYEQLITVMVNFEYNGTENSSTMNFAGRNMKKKVSE